MSTSRVLNGRYSSILAIALIGAVIAIGAEGAEARDSARVKRGHAPNCPTCFQADTTASAAPAHADPLGPILCKRAMDSSPELKPLCGQYR